MNGHVVTVDRAGGGHVEKTEDVVGMPMVAGAAMVAGLVHVLVAVDHAPSARWMGLAFVGVGALQLGLAAALLRGPGRVTLWAGTVGTIGVICAYVASRTVGLPGPVVHATTDDGHGPAAAEGAPEVLRSATTIETVGALDMICLLAELGLVAGLVSALPEATRGRTTFVLMLVGLGALVARGFG